MKNKNLIWIIGGAALLMWYLNTKQSQPTTAQKRQALIKWISEGGDSMETIMAATVVIQSRLTDSEINALYSAVFTYHLQNMPQSLRDQINVIGSKYGIFS